eukprot:1470005-Amphidinium_carterae.2
MSELILCTRRGFLWRSLSWHRCITNYPVDGSCCDLLHVRVDGAACVVDVHRMGPRAKNVLAAMSFCKELPADGEKNLRTTCQLHLRGDRSNPPGGAKPWA